MASNTMNDDITR